MFDVYAVQQPAYEHNFYDLVSWLEYHRKEYFQFILSGKQ